jgi:hypothetical protein
MKRRWGRCGFPRRESPELHPGPWQGVPKVGGGLESDFTIRGRSFLKLPRSRHLAVFLLVFTAVGALAAYLGWPVVDGLLNLLGVIGAMGGVIWFVAGSLGVLAAVVYYYTAGIDWPKEEAYRIVAVGASIGLVIVVLVLALAHLEGRVHEVWPSLLKVGLGLAIAATAGWIGQRSGG